MIKYIHVIEETNVISNSRLQDISKNEVGKHQ